MVPMTVNVGVADVQVAAVQHGGKVWVSVRRVCEALGLNADGQRVKLAEKPWACTEMISVRDQLGRQQAAFFIDLDSLPMWLATIDHARVDDAIVHRLITFQREAKDVLARHFGLDGVAHPTGGQRSSGGVTTSGGTMMSGAAELLAMVKGLTGALEATLAETAAVRAAVDHVSSQIRNTAETADEARALAAEGAGTAIEAQTLARVAMQHAERAAGKPIPAYRRRAATSHITRQMQAFCGRHGLKFRDFFAGVRRELGLRPRADGGPALSQAALSPEKIILMARYATSKGVPGCGARTIEDLLTGLDEVSRPGFIDMPTSAPKTVQ